MLCAYIVCVVMISVLKLLFSSPFLNSEFILMHHHDNSSTVPLERGAEELKSDFTLFLTEDVTAR